MAGVSPAYTARQMSHIYDEYGAAVQGKAYTAARVEEKTKEGNGVKHTKARMYLQKIKDFEARIKGKKALLKELTSNLLDVSSVGFSDEKVSGGLAVPKGFADTIIKKIELENEINADIIRFIGLKNDITNAIYKLDNPVYISILFKKYVEGKDFEKIVEEVHYEPGYVYNMHGQALEAFDKICEEM